jgi:hypothetical protein
LREKEETMKGITITELREALIEAQERMFLICNEHSNKDQYQQGRDHGILSALTEVLGFLNGEKENIIDGYFMIK